MVAGTACLTMVCSMAAGNLCSEAWSTSCPPPALTLVPAELFLSRIRAPLWLLFFPAGFFPPFLNLLSQSHYHHR